MFFDTAYRDSAPDSSFFGQMWSRGAGATVPTGPERESLRADWSSLQEFADRDDDVTTDEEWS